MKKIFLLSVSQLLLQSVFAQGNTISIQDKNYLTSTNWEFKVDTSTKKNTLTVCFVKDSTNGYIYFANSDINREFNNENIFDSIVITLANNKLINVTKLVATNNIDELVATMYSLDAIEISELRKSSISSIQYCITNERKIITKKCIAKNLGKETEIHTIDIDGNIIKVDKQKVPLNTNEDIEEFFKF